MSDAGMQGGPLTAHARMGDDKPDSKLNRSGIAGGHIV
jgi:hypothetical protein